MEEILRSMRRAAVAFSGGVDSAYLLAEARRILGGGNVLAVTAVSPVFPEREREEAKRLCGLLDVRQIEVAVELLELEAFKENPKDRCYSCKYAIMSAMKRAAEREGFSILLEGSNADDAGDFRPGLAAIRELGIGSPLMDAGLTKKEIRERAREMGLPVWNKPSSACLASRIAYGEEITEEKVKAVEKAEEYLRSLGLCQLRVRVHEGIARIETEKARMGLLLENRVEITEKLHALGFRYVTADLDGFRSGSMN